MDLWARLESLLVLLADWLTQPDQGDLAHRVPIECLVRWNLQPYLSTAMLKKLTVVFEYCEAIGTYSRT